MNYSDRINIGLSRSTNGQGKVCLIKLTFLLVQDDEEFGQMLLILNPKMAFIDENWYIDVDVDSPHVIIESEDFRQTYQV
ncbi:hypothetical protein QUF58_05940 [Anaerolineales bacterium HSG24]|nr:hypothetical protein [Anaerolineales bacterium HSG24]